MTRMLLPLGQALNGTEVQTIEDCIITHAGTKTPVGELAYLVWHACQLNPRAATSGKADRDAVCSIVARALRTGVGPVRHLDPRDGVEELRDAELLAELRLPREGSARLGVGAAWNFFETHRLVPAAAMTDLDRADWITGAVGEAEVPTAVAAVVRSSAHTDRLVNALVEAVEDNTVAGQQAYTEVIGFLPLVLGLGAAHLERVGPLNHTSPRVARFIGITPPSDPRCDRTG